MLALQTAGTCDYRGVGDVGHAVLTSNCCAGVQIIAGQALMALADTAMVMALWSASGAFRPVATVDMTTTFMGPATQTAIIAEATVLRLGRTLGFCQVRLLMDTLERPLVAHGAGSYSIPPA